MRKFLFLLFAITSAPLLHAQEDKAPGKQHPAVAALISWAQSENGNKEEKKAFFTPQEIEMIETMGKSNERGIREFREFVLSGKDDLTFKQTQDKPNAGSLYIKGKRFLPVKLEDNQWKGDLVKMMKDVKAKAKLSMAEQDISFLKTALENYRIIGGTYPSEKQGLVALIEKPSTAPRPRRWVQTLDSKQGFEDPWGNPYQYKLVDGKPVIISLGPDGKVSEDDVSSE